MRILALSDLHYSDLSRNMMRRHDDCGVLGRTLLKKAILRLEHMQARPDLIVITGDLLAGDDHPSAQLDLIALKGELTRSGIPFLALPGNHDIDAAEFNRIMGTAPGLHRIGGYGFIVFNDTFERGKDSDPCRREPEDVALPRQIADENPDLPLIALQHAPVYPRIDAAYPYNPLNASEIIESYRASGVVLSLSGHYHPGAEPAILDNTLYYTTPSLKNSPCPFALIELDGATVTITPLALKMTEDYLCDVHCHTEHAYCATTADTAKCIALSRMLGVKRLCITEHAFQLYFPRKTAMSFLWQSNPAMAREVWQTPERGRMRNYREYVAAFRSDYTRAGLEVDLFDDGQLLLAPEDWAFGWDILVGAVHFIQGFRRGEIGQSEAETLFMRDFERMLAHGVHVMAHPFRFFGRNGLATPTRLYRPVAELLVRYGCAAEINYHTYAPDPAFIRLCVECGVRVALGSDTHDLVETGEFYPHLDLMRRAGITAEEIKKHLFITKM